MARTLPYDRDGDLPLFPGETLIEVAGYPILAHFRCGDAARPLAVFLPGGGHLARIAYGHPGARPTDFIDHWFGEKGFGLLALSYPNDHPAFPAIYPAMTSADRADCAAQATKQFVQQAGLPGTIVLVGWSMAGKTVPQYSRKAAALGLTVDSFVSLAATPPLPGLARYAPGGEQLTGEGLWDCATPLDGGRSRHDGWQDELRQISDANGHGVISADIYCRDYRCGTPIQLRGEAARYRAGTLSEDVAEAVDDLATFDFASYPITGTIVPTTASDCGHALTGTAMWGFFTARAIYERFITRHGFDPTRLEAEEWNELQGLMQSLPGRLSRNVEGGHLFFVGERDPRATANCIDTLVAEIHTVTEHLTLLTTPQSGRFSVVESPEI